MKGFDISEHQWGINLAKAKAEGYDFVIIRGARTGFGAGRRKAKDVHFDEFYKEAKKVGLHIGSYYYSCANSRQGGIDEANFYYENCLKGKTFDMPIYIDVENTNWQGGNKKGVTEAIIGFCETLEAKGYFVGVYANVFWFNKMIDTAKLGAYSKWVASWSKEKPVFNYSGFDMWQCSGDSGQIKKVAGQIVDTNIAFVDFPTLINGKKKKPEKKEKKTTDQIANEVIAGKWGNGETRKQKLTEAGYDYNTIQKRVNALIKPAERYYKVQKGDTLSEIAKKHKTTVTKLKKANNIKDVNKIYAGQMIKIV